MRDLRVDYLVGGLRISLSSVNTSPGPRTHILSFTSALRTLGWSVRLIVASSMPFMARFSRMSPRAVAASSPTRLVIGDLVRLASAVWTGLITFGRTVGRPRPSLIYERAAVMQSLSSFHAAKALAPRVVEVNGILSRETAHDRRALRFERLASAIERHVFRRATLLVAVSESLKSEIVSFARVPADRILVVPNGIDETLASTPLPAERGPVIGFVGTLSGWQRLDLLLESIALSPSLRVEIIGDGLERERLEELAHRTGLADRVIFHGRREQADAFALMRSWRIGFAGHEKSSSSVMYHSPLKLYEYAAFGLDVVATESADARALRASGLRVEFYGRDRPLADAIAAALALPDRSSTDVESLRARLIAEHGWTTRVRQVLDRLGL